MVGLAILPLIFSNAGLRLCYRVGKVECAAASSLNRVLLTDLEPSTMCHLVVVECMSAVCIKLSPLGALQPRELV